jgi:titin
MTARSSPPGLPSVPFDLIAVASGGCQVILAWTERRAGGLGFRIERATCNSPCKSFTEIGKVGQYVTAFSDRSVDPRTTYHYRVRAWSASGDSLPSNVVEVTTLQAEMEPPVDKE